jgi:hypothetical protein
MLSGSLVFLSTTAFCLAILTVLLSESEQRRIADWTVEAWATIEDFRAYLGTKYVFKLVLEDSPPTTALATIGGFVGGLFGASIFGVFLVFGVCALLGAILFNDTQCVEPPATLLMWIYGGMALTGLLGLIQGIWMSLLSVAAVIAACILFALSIAEFLACRLAEHQKGPIIALGLLVAATLSLS